MEKPEIILDTKLSEFRIKSNKKDYGKLTFIKNDNYYTFNHIYIPVDQRGKGLSFYLANYSFDHALKNNWNLKVTCSWLLGTYLPTTKLKYAKLLLK